MRAGVGGLERNPVVFWIVTPSPGFISPDDAATLEPASISPDKTIDGTRIGQEENAVSHQGDLKRFRIAVLDGSNRSPANSLGLKRRRRRDKRSARGPGKQQNSPERFSPIHRSPPNHQQKSDRSRSDSVLPPERAGVPPDYTHMP